MRDPDYVRRQHKQIERALADIMGTIALHGMRGLDIYGMLSTTAAATHAVTEGIVKGARLKHALAPEQVDLDQLRMVRTAVIDLLDLAKSECLQLIDTAIAHIHEDDGDADRFTTTAPIHEQVRGEDAKRGPVPTAEELKRMFRVGTETGR